MITQRGVLLVLFYSLSVLFGCDPRYGFVESVFQLSNDSRLPRSLSNPPGFSKKDLTITITFYTHPISKNKVKLTVYGPPPERRKLAEKVGTTRWHPYTEQEFKGRQGYAVYPSYLIMTFDGVEDVFEHRSKGDILFITDDPRLTQILRRR